MVEVLDQFGLQAAIPAVVFGSAGPQGLAQLSGSLRVEREERELRVLHERVEQGSARLLGGHVDVASRAEFLDELEHPVVQGLSRVSICTCRASSSPGRSRQMSCLASAQSMPTKTEIGAWAGQLGCSLGVGFIG